MGITVAHELVYFFVGFLTGYDRPSTPEEVTYLPSLYSSQTAGGIDVGESGRAWEGSVFGGIVEVWGNSSSPLGVYQAGDLCIIDSNKMVREVDHASVKRILALCKFTLDPSTNNEDPNDWMSHGLPPAHNRACYRSVYAGPGASSNE